MKKTKVDNSLPAFLEGFSKDEKNEKFTRAKLKVFYIGETADHRIIKDKCAKAMMATLPYTPVVSYYDAEADDFIGHASEQSIFGIVDPCTKPEFIEEDGKTWAVCDIVLYTERPDLVGKIAQKVIGHPQSLEMDPKTMQYIVNYTSDHKIKSIEFEKAEFVGVSVLGNKQRPAFTGSSFFSTSDFEYKMTLLKNYCEERGKQMDGQNEVQNEVQDVQKFMELSWSEKQKTVGEALRNTYCCYIIDMYDDYAVAWVYDEDTGRESMQKFSYTFADDGSVSISSGIPVRVVYEEIPMKEPEQAENQMSEQPVQPDASIKEVETPTDGAEPTVATVDQNSCGGGEDDPKKKKPEDAESQPDKKDEDKKDDEKKDDDPSKASDQSTTEDNAASTDTTSVAQAQEQTETPTNVDEAQNVAAQSQMSEGQSAEQVDTATSDNSENSNEQGVQNEGTDSTSTFSDSERQELNQLREEKKRALLGKYEYLIPREMFNKYSETIGDYNYEELQNALDNEKSKHVGNKVKVFKRFDSMKSQSTDRLTDLIREYSNK